MEDTEQAQIPEVADQDVVIHEKSPKESFAELRRAKEDLERQLWEVKKEKELAERYMQAHARNQDPVEEDFDYRTLEQEEFPDGKKLVKALNTFNKKMSQYEKKLAEKDQKIQILETATEFPDFREVVTAENIEKYINSDEDNREAVETAKNPLRKVYNLIKKSAAYQADKAQKAPPYQEVRRLEDKESKPKTGPMGVRSESVSTIAALSNSQMTREMRAQLMNQTLIASRGKPSSN